MNTNLVPRLQWGASSPRSKETMKRSAQRVIVHHTAMAYCEGPQECKENLVLIPRMHMNDRGFDDIGYNFLIGGDGLVYEGRGWGIVGAHTRGNNHNSVGIAFMGNFNNTRPSQAALSSVKRLLQYGTSQGHLDVGFIVLGHRDLGNTECPGDHLYASLHHLSVR